MQVDKRRSGENSEFNPLLSVKDLAVVFGQKDESVKAVKSVSFDVLAGETVGLVGESGSGKSVTAMSILQLLPYPFASHPVGSIKFHGVELLGADKHTMRQVRGNRIAMIFQEPTSSLNPLLTVEDQITEVLEVHRGMDRTSARLRALELLNLVNIPDAERRLGAYPHELSGGQAQRVMIAIALATEPDLLVADEPTTALDVIIQAEILELLASLQRQFGMALLLITHDLQIVRMMAHRVCVMHSGELVEQGSAEQVFNAPEHPYTKMLLSSQPQGRNRALPSDAEEILVAQKIQVLFPVRTGVFRRVSGHIRAVDGVSLTIRRGQTVAIVGESGSGKTTLGRALLRLQDSEGSIRFQSKEISDQSIDQLQPLRKHVQIVFQDPFSSLNPRHRIGRIVGEGLNIHKVGSSHAERIRLVREVLQEVGIDPDAMRRFPHEFSGGQRQRIAIARVLVLRPDLIVLDEPTSALDRSVQAQIIDLLRDLQHRHGIAYLFISHDLVVVRALAHEVMVMKDGKIVEHGPAEKVLSQPKNPYTRTLIRAALDLESFKSPKINYQK